MRKIAWPWIGSTEHEMGSMTSSFQDVDQTPYEDYDSLVPEKSVYEGAAPTTEYSEGRISPVDGDGQEISLADDDSEEETVVSVYDKDKKLASFKCDIAKTFQEKVNGLQVYSSLGSDSGLLFEYDRPQDVLYHMGTVKFPIDIIFIDEDQKIKKICKNIQPGTLGTFGCANTLYVLEVIGGTSDQLGFKSGDKVKVKRGRSSTIKSASVTRNYKIPKLVYVYNFDGIISRNPDITISKMAEYNEENITLRYDGEVFTPGSPLTIKVHELEKYPGYFFSKTASGLDGFLENSTETYEAYQDLKEAFKDPENVIVFSTAMESPKEVVRAFLSKLEVLYGSLNKRETVICKIANNYNHINVIEDLREIYPYSEIRLFADDELSKKAGTPIPSHIKEQAKEALKSLDLGKKSLQKSIAAVKQNLTEYEKLRDREDKIKETQGQFHQSIKRNVELAKQYLLSIRDAIRILNKIKDATTTIEIIESLASASHRASESIQEIFDLINKMNTPDFVMLLTESTGNYEKAAEDLESTIKRAKDYINTNILGIIVLST